MLDFVVANTRISISELNEDLLFRTYAGMTLEHTYYAVERLICIELSEVIRLDLYLTIGDLSADNTTGAYNA